VIVAHSNKKNKVVGSKIFPSDKPNDKRLAFIPPFWNVRGGNFLSEASPKSDFRCTARGKSPKRYKKRQ